MLHPDWTETQIVDEVSLIEEHYGAAPPPQPTAPFGSPAATEEPGLRAVGEE